MDSEYWNTENTFSMSTPSHVLYGWGSSSGFVEKFVSLLEARESSSPRVLLLTDEILHSAGITNSSIEALDAQAVTVEVFTRSPGEPTATEINELGKFVNSLDPDGIVAVGGGATMDSAKLARVLHQFGNKAEDYTGVGKIPERATVPLAAVTTTSGTGSETGPTAIFTDDVSHTKEFVSSSYMMPDLAVVDPQLTMSVPAATTAFTGLDALGQAMGPFMSPLKHPLTDVFSFEAVNLISHNIEKAYSDGSDREARVGMAYGSLMMGLAMNNSECIGEHFFAEIVGPRYDLAHGHSVAIFLPYILQYNRDFVPDRTAQIAKAVLDDIPSDTQEVIDALILAVDGLLSSLNVPRLAEVGVVRSDLEELADQVSGHIGIELELNPRPMTRDDCLRVLESVFDGVPALEMKV